MDPTECFISLVECYVDKDTDGAFECLAALLDWTSNGGAPPAGFRNAQRLHNLLMLIENDLAKSKEEGR